MLLMRLLLALVSGFLLTLAFPRWNLGLISWGWMFPLLYALWARGGSRVKLQGLRDATDNAKPQPRTKNQEPTTLRGFSLAYLAGVAFFIPNLAWVRHSSRVIGGAVGEEWMGWGVELMGLGAVLGLSLYCAIYWGLWGAFATTLGRPRIDEEGDTGKLFSVSVESLRSAFLCAAAWVACEWLRGYVFTGFGWNGLGASLQQSLSLIQSADLVGVTGLSFLPVFVMVIGYNTVLRFRLEVRTSRVRPHADFFCAVALMLANFGYGAWRLSQSPGETIPLRTMLVQTNVPQHIRWSGEHTGQLYRDLGQLTEVAMITAKPDLVIWPESALPLSFYDPNHIGFLNDVLGLGDFSLLTGVDIDVPNDPPYTGAALLRGKFENHQLHRKVHLVPFGEYLPLRSIPLVESLLGGVLPGDFASGKIIKPLVMEQPAGVQLIPLICFEDTVGRLARKFIREAPQLLVNCSNDGWFLQSAENEQHLVNAIFRSIELRRPMARACNTGVTCFVDTCGRIGAKDRLSDAKTGSYFVKGVLNKVIEVPRVPEMTFYAKHGDVFSLAMLIITVGSAVVGFLFRSKARPKASE
jgi:apolipoprotein N-acyltransferase